MYRMSSSPHEPISNAIWGKTTLKSASQTILLVKPNLFFFLYLSSLISHHLEWSFARGSNLLIPNDSRKLLRFHLYQALNTSKITGNSVIEALQDNRQTIWAQVMLVAHGKRIMNWMKLYTILWDAVSVPKSRQFMTDFKLQLKNIWTYLIAVHWSHKLMSSWQVFYTSNCCYSMLLADELVPWGWQLATSRV